MKRLSHHAALAAGSMLVASSMWASVAVAAGPAPGDATITLSLNDSAAGGSYDQVFEKAYSGTTTDGTPVYIYVPQGAVGDPTVDSMDPQFDHDTADDFTPCATTLDSAYLITQDQINDLGIALEEHIVAIDVAHFGPITGGQAKALVTLVYNVQDDSYYDCAETTYTAGYFAPEFLAEYDMNVMVIDAFDWANRIGDQTGNPVGRPELYEGVFAHELEHLLQNYSDPGELSWVDEGLADFAIFLNGYDVGGSHLTYEQVFHRETSLTRWGGGLENYGASYTWTQYLWEQAGGNGAAAGAQQYKPDSTYSAVAGDLLIKKIFEEPADGMAGVQNAIDDFNSQTGATLRSTTELFKDWALAVYLDQEGSSLYDIRAVDFGNPAYTRWTIDMANEVFWDDRGIYTGAMPEAKWDNFKRVPSQSALPFGVSYERFKNPGPTFSVKLDGAATTQIAPHSAPKHWYGGFESQKNNILDVDYVSGTTIDFWTWYFIEEGWDYGFVEVTNNGVDWSTIPLTNDAGATVTTNDDPHDQNTEGNALTGTSGGVYFVDQPQYTHLSGVLPTGTTDVRFRYETDAAYNDTGWFVDDVKVGGAAATVSTAPGNWIETTGTQDNDFVVQLVSPCDLTPDATIAGETVYEYGSIYRLGADAAGDVNVAGFSTRCLNSTRDTITAVISNMPTGDLQYLDADYLFRVTNTSNKK